MALGIQIAKLKIHQYLLRANSPNLMLAKFSLYTSEQMDFNFSVDIPWTACSWQVFIKLIQLSSWICCFLCPLLLTADELNTNANSNAFIAFAHACLRLHVQSSWISLGVGKLIWDIKWFLWQLEANFLNNFGYYISRVLMIIMNTK